MRPVALLQELAGALTPYGTTPMITVICPTCKKRLSVADERAGESFECPNCDAAFTIPLVESAQPRSRASDNGDRRPPARRREDDDDHDEGEDRRPRRRFPCPNCGSVEVPLRRKRISTTGWIVFAVLLVCTVIFFWVGLLIKEEYRVCPECGAEQP